MLDQCQQKDLEKGSIHDRLIRSLILKRLILFFWLGVSEKNKRVSIETHGCEQRTDFTILDTYNDKNYLMAYVISIFAKSSRSDDFVRYAFLLISSKFRYFQPKICENR